jgi:hypothetical protein
VKHPTFADNAFLAFLDRRLGERFPNSADVVGEDVPQAIAEDFRAWINDPATRAMHHPLELCELQEIMAVQWGIPVTSDRTVAPDFHHGTGERAASLGTPASASSPHRE